MKTNNTKKKTAEVEYNILEEIQNRKSIRAFSNESIPLENIKSLFEAARWAPSSMNEQPWRYVYATKDQPELWKKLFDALDTANQVWVENCYLLIFSFVKKTFTRNGKINHYAHHDLGAANALIALQAVRLELQVHQMAGYDHDTIVNNIHIPPDYDPGVMMAVGYPGDLKKLPENLQSREIAPRERFIQAEFVMNEIFFLVFGFTIFTLTF